MSWTREFFAAMDELARERGLVGPSAQSVVNGTQARMAA
jgi:hypothetical protein